MLYKGLLYAKVAGKYVPVEHDAQYYDQLEAENARLKCCGNCRFYNGNCLNTKMKDNPLYIKDNSDNSDEILDVIFPYESPCGKKLWKPRR